MIRLAVGLMRDRVGARTLVRMVALQLLVALTEGLGLVLVVPVVQSLGGASRLHLPAGGADLSVPVAFGLVVAVVVVRGFAQWRGSVLALDIRLRTIDGVRLDLLSALYRARWSYLAAQRRSIVVQRLTTEVERAHNALTLLMRLVVGVLVVGMTIAAGIVISPEIGGLSALCLLVIALLARGSIGGATRLGRRMTERMADFGATLTDSLASVRVMRAHDASDEWSRLVGDDAARVRDVRRAYVSTTSGVVAALGVVAVLAVLGVILVGRAAGMSTAELAALGVVATRLLSSAQGLVVTAQAFANDAPALERLRDFAADIREHPEPATLVLAAPATAATAATAGTPANVADRPRAFAPVRTPLVSLRGVTLTYAGEDRPALGGVDLDVPRRGLVGVTGPSGSGKSTLVDVLIGLLPPDRGTVLVDGRPLTDLPAWKSRLGYVPQQTVLVPGTVWQNLAWSLQPERTLAEDDAWAALRDACLDDVVGRLPGGLQAPLDEVARLSGGEQQRLMIARALVRDPDLLVLDEATAGLDGDTEARVIARLRARGCAVLMVTHREGPLAGAVARIRLEDGVVVREAERPRFRRRWAGRA